MTTTTTLTHIPSPGECTGLRGTALCGRTATYRTGDHDLIRRRATAALLQPADADDCPECRAILAGQWIRTRRGETSQAAIAKAIGVAANTIARYERGEMAAPLTVLLAVDRVC